MNSTTIAPASNSSAHNIPRMTAALICCGLACLLLSAVMGVLSGLYYLPEFAETMESAGLTLQKLRPIHVTLATGWIFLAAVGAIYHHLSHVGETSLGDRVRFRSQMLLWLFAGILALMTLSFGVFSGREYVGFHPFLSLLIYCGWICLVWNFFRKIGKGIFSQPIHIYMWAIGLLFFLYTFAEAHSWLLPWIGNRPLVDLQLQWKSAGTMVGSMNLLVYGSLAYLGKMLSNDNKSCHSKLTFALFGLGLLNSFTNYTHHTYHLPQREIVKWIGFVISMSEVILLWRVITEILGLWKLRAAKEGRCPTLTKTRSFVVSVKSWTTLNLFFSLLISIPPLNSLIHGTHVVFAHAMGAMIGIDTIVLLAVISYFAVQITGANTSSNSDRILKWGHIGLNIGLSTVVAAMTYKGVIDGYHRYMGHAKVDSFDLLYLFVIGGTILSISLISLCYNWIKIFLPVAIAKDTVEESSSEAYSNT